MSKQYIYPPQVRKMLDGKTILVIGYGDIGLRYVWETFNSRKVKIVLVDFSANNHRDLQVDTFIHYDYRDPTQLEEHASNIIQRLEDKVTAVSGCLTFCADSAIPLTAMICQKLGLRGTHPDAAMITMSKHKTYEALRLEDKDSEFEMHAPMSFRIEKAQDITKAKPLAYPAILIPEYESYSFGVQRVLSTADSLKQYDKIQEVYEKIWDGSWFGNSMVLMEMIQGRSFVVDIVMYDGECLAAYVTDMGPSLPEVYVTTTTCTPTSLPARKREQLTTAAFNCCLRVGLLNGVYNLEFKIDKFGNTTLVEINGNVTCYMRCIVYQTTHGVDLFGITAAIACGIKPRFPEVKPRCFAVGCYLYPGYHGMQLSKHDVMEKLKSFMEGNDILLIMKTLAIPVIAMDFPKPFGHLVAIGDSHGSARRKLIQLFSNLGLLRDDFDIEKLA